MILDRLDRFQQYTKLHPAMQTALDFCAQAGELPVGRYEFEGGFMMVQEGDTPCELGEGLFEAHKKYIDLQIVASGSEWVSWADLDTLELAKPYQPDAWFFRGKGMAAYHATEGMAYVMYPRDGHMTCCHKEVSTHFRKYVVKLPVASVD